ncbi:hypothetical protein B6U91_01665 [Candidatus Pacearchaeota archaeon ex4484_71]|nr:MAG: hypothetical protein B6U91_01665 [Candidatus Pacearchaeota archaeon ex4484_71]
MEEKNKDSQLEKDLAAGTVVIAKFGHNYAAGKPFEFLYEFGYYTRYGAVVYLEGCRNMQDARAFKLDQLRKAEEGDLKKYLWGH